MSMPSSRRDLIQSASAAAKAITRYSNSIEDRAMDFCLLEDQEMALVPRKTTRALVEDQSSGFPTQSGSK